MQRNTKVSYQFIYEQAELKPQQSWEVENSHLLKTFTLNNTHYNPVNDERDRDISVLNSIPAIENTAEKDGIRSAIRGDVLDLQNRSLVTVDRILKNIKDVESQNKLIGIYKDKLMFHYDKHKPKTFIGYALRIGLFNGFKSRTGFTHFSFKTGPVIPERLNMLYSQHKIPSIDQEAYYEIYIRGHELGFLNKDKYLNYQVFYENLKEGLEELENILSVPSIQANEDALWNELSSNANITNILAANETTFVNNLCDNVNESTGQHKRLQPLSPSEDLTTENKHQKVEQYSAQMQSAQDINENNITLTPLIQRFGLRQSENKSIQITSDNTRNENSWNNFSA